VKSRLVLSLGLSIGAVGVEPGVIRTANETGEIALVCGHDALAVGLSGLGWVTSDIPVQVVPATWYIRSSKVAKKRKGCSHGT